MSHMFTVDELEKEILYLREQNQKLIKELSALVKENTALRDELALERGEEGDLAIGNKRSKQKKVRTVHSQDEKPGGMLCLN